MSWQTCITLWLDTQRPTQSTHTAVWLLCTVHVYIQICGHVQFTHEHISIINNTCGSGLICSWVQIQALIYTLRRLDLKHYYQNMYDPTKDDGVWTYLGEKANTHVLLLLDKMEIYFRGDSRWELISFINASVIIDSADRSSILRGFLMVIFQCG